jgi:hypothetical protein
VDMEFLDAQPSIGLLSKLKYFKLHDVIGDSNEMQFIELVLLKAKYLEKIEVFVDFPECTESADVVSCKLEICKKASPHVEVVC